MDNINNQIDIEPKKNNFKHTAAKLFVIVFLTVCLAIYIYHSKSPSNNDELTSVSADKLSNIQVCDYFPNNTNSSFIYQIYADSDSDNYKKGDVVSNDTINFSALKKTTSGAMRSLFIERITVGDVLLANVDGYYDVDSKFIQKVAYWAPSMADSALIISNETKWQETKDIYDAITATNLKINTIAGEFSNCIEVTQRATNNKVVYLNKYYYAPKIGLIMVMVPSSPPNKGYIKTKELVKYSAYNSINSQQPEPNEAGSNQGINYTNKDLDFSITLPSWWANKYTVKENKDQNYISFLFTPNGKNYDNMSIFSIYYQELSKVDPRDPHDFGGILKANSKYQFTYSVPTQATNELLLPENKDDLMTMQKMESEISNIAKTFKFL